MPRQGAEIRSATGSIATVGAPGATAPRPPVGGSRPTHGGFDSGRAGATISHAAQQPAMFESLAMKRARTQRPLTGSRSRNGYLAWVTLSLAANGALLGFI